MMRSRHRVVKSSKTLKFMLLENRDLSVLSSFYAAM